MQSIGGTFLYISRAVDLTMFIVLNEIGSEQDLTITDTIKKTKMLMDYDVTQPDAIIRFHASNIYIHIDSDAA